MKKFILPILLMVFIANVNGQSKEEMEVWNTNMKPSKFHKWIAQFDGTWSGQSKMWMDPKQPPMESKMVTTNEMILEGRYQRSTNTGRMMEQEFVGEGIMGYDNASKKFVSTWIDNMGTGIIFMEGELSKDEKILTLYGMMKDPISGKDMKIKQTLTLVSDNEHKFEMYMITDGNEFKTLEIMYTREG
ncbi:DUF1579 domain-containing protein [Psychroserpens sp. XS_ASV72]|uniref:DUF1579 domain-containing protein n=1 Tax=Psychroserpens sp. XS_ASV72 TaxID=3241293 RepID=UPI0035189B29